MKKPNLSKYFIIRVLTRAIQPAIEAADYGYEMGSLISSEFNQYPDWVIQESVDRIIAKLGIDIVSLHDLIYRSEEKTRMSESQYHTLSLIFSSYDRNLFID